MGVPRTTALSLGPRRPVHRSWCLFDVWMYLCAVVNNSCLKPGLQGGERSRRTIRHSGKTVSMPRTSRLGLAHYHPRPVKSACEVWGKLTPCCNVENEDVWA